MAYEAERWLETMVFGEPTLISRCIAWLAKQYIETENRPAHTLACFHAACFTEVVFKPVAYGLSGAACQFLFLVMSLSGRQTFL
jgi:hypothetical protein